MSDLVMNRGGSFDIGRVLERTFGVVGANFPVLLMLALVLSAAPQAVVALISTSFGAATPGLSEVYIGGIVGFVSGLLLQASVVHASVVDLNGRKAKFGDSLRVAAMNFLPVLGISILLILALLLPFVFATVLLKWLGVLLSLIPILMMALAWAVAVPAQVIEQTGVIQSFGRSAQLTRGSRWRLLAMAFIYMLLALAFWILAAIVIALFGALGGGPQGILTQAILTPVISAVFSMLGAAGVAAIYYELRSKKEGAAPQELVAIFD